MAIIVSNDAPELMQVIPPMPNEDQQWHCFTSPESMCDYLEQATFWRGFDIKPSFYGVRTMADAISLCRHGWPEGADRVAKLRDKINAQNPTGPRLVRYDVAGAYPIVARAIAGNPMSMKRYDTARLRRRPVLTLINHMGGLADVPFTSFTNKCAVVAAIVDAIENAGYSCHVIGLSQSAHNDNGAGYLCGVAATVKNPGEQVDIGRMAFALGHVAMFRHLVFRTRVSDTRNKALGGMGYTTDFQGNVPESVYVLPSMNVNAKFFSTESIAATAGLNHLVSSLAAQGCPAFPQSQQAA